MSLWVRQAEEQFLTCCSSAACSGVTAPALQRLHQGRAGETAQDEAAEWELGKAGKRCISPCWILARMLKLNTWLINKKSCSSSPEPCWDTGICAVLWRWTWLFHYSFTATSPRTLLKLAQLSLEWQLLFFPDEKAFPAASQPSLPPQRAQRLSYPDQGMPFCFICCRRAGDE